jgi:N-formylglutamate deformylase
MSDVFTLRRGRAPLLISLPHHGAAIPPELAGRMLPAARRAPDTDWWMAELYGPLAEALDASLLVPRWSRYVIDLNRPPDDASLYPGQNTTGLCPVVQFSGEPIYRAGEAPVAEEIAARRTRYWQPYHDALAVELDRLRGLHPQVLLWEGHSIRSVVPFLFEGRLPDLNLGTAAGASCAPAVEAALTATLAAQSTFSWVANGRFKGGYITRRYGQPAQGVHAVQLETAQAAYMAEPDGPWDPDRGAPLQRQIEQLLTAALAVIPTPH